MIYEMRIYNFKPGGAVGQWEQNFLEAYQGTREKYSKLYGMWHTDFGPLNQAIHIWQYDSLQQRADIRAAAAKDPSGNGPRRAPTSSSRRKCTSSTPWPTLRSGTANPRSWPASGNCASTPTHRRLGRLLLPYRGDSSPQRVYPIGGIFTSDLGDLNRLYQLFPYKDWAHREEVRKPSARRRTCGRRTRKKLVPSHSSCDT